jgi:hypothetical protein
VSIPLETFLRGIFSGGKNFRKYKMQSGIDTITNGKETYVLGRKNFNIVFYPDLSINPFKNSSFKSTRIGR